MNEVRPVNLPVALLPFLALIGTAILDLLYWRTFYIPMVAAIIVTAIIGYFIGYRWNELESFMVKGAKDSISIVMIMFIIGSIIGTWILSGTIPTLIYYGLIVISPAIFIPTVALTTAVMSMVIGSSITTIATVGVALMAIGQGMGFPPGLVAGAVISGAFFGDKLSPLSDTTIMAPGLADTDLFSHIRHMLWDTIPAFMLSLILFYVVGLTHSVAATDINSINALLSALEQNFNIHLFLLAISLVTIYIMYKRLPAIPSLLLLAVIGGIFAFFFQGSTINEIVLSIANGYSGESGDAAMDSLLNRGGIQSMFFTVTLIIIAMILGGILEGTGIFNRIISVLIQKSRTTGSLILTTVLSTLVVAFASGSQALSIVLPAKGFQKTYKDRGLDTKNLSRCVEAAGTVGITLVPWGIVSIFASGAFGGLSPYTFIPFIFFAFLVPIINVIYGFSGFTIAKKDYSKQTKVTNQVG